MTTLGTFPVPQVPENITHPAANIADLVYAWQVLPVL